jgi:type IV secretory pathway VirB10-like protein
MSDLQESVPSLQKKATPPAGLLPRNTQAWVVGGISVLMILVIALSGRTPPKGRQAAAAATGVDTSSARIEEYKRQIEQEAEKLQLEKTQLARTQADMAGTSPSVTSNPSYSYMAQGLRPTNLDEDSFEADKRKFEYQSLFASNLALSHREEVLARTSTKSPEASTPEPEKAQSADSGGPSTSSQGAGLSPTESKLYRLFEGTILETVLTNRLDGTFSGPVNCMVTTDVYSHNGQHLLIPQGTRVLGEVHKVDTFGQQRLAVVFHRMIMPDGYSASLDKFQGLSQAGETGLRDQINHHYVQVFGVSLAIGAIAGLSQANTQYGTSESAADAYRQGVATSLSQSSLQILDRYLNVLPTFTIREGHRVKIYLSADLSLPAYDQHPPADNM